MPRAHRYFLPGHVWHITQRCHQQEFLLKFAKDRQRWRCWLFEARKRYGLCVLNYMVTSNHIHMLVFDQGRGEIARSMQLVAGRTAQEYNLRKGRKGAYWEDRYHATAVDTNTHLARCMVYIDLNMVRAGAVTSPADWPWCGYCEIQSPAQRYSIIDKKVLTRLFGQSRYEDFQILHQQWIDTSLKAATLERDASWSDSLAVGHRSFVNEIQQALGIDARYRRVVEGRGHYVLKEPSIAYAAHFSYEKRVLSHENGIIWI